MPELPEVETVMRGMEAAIKNRTVKRVIPRRDGLRVPFPEDLAKKLQSKRIENLSRRAKYILMQAEGGQTMILHLGMSGRILLVPPHQKYDYQKHDHLCFEFDDESKMVFNDPRRFGMVMLAANDEIESHKAFCNLGPEPLDNNFNGPVLFATLKNKKTNMKAALMDQRVVAGLGNIYVCESLFFAGIHPERRACDVSAAECEKLVRAIRDVLGRAVAAGGSTLKDYRHADGELGYFQHEFSVYDRAGETCPDCVCDIKKTLGVRKMTQSGRTTYYCPEKQKMPQK